MRAATLVFVFVATAASSAFAAEPASPAVCNQRIARLEAIFRNGDARAKMAGPFLSLEGLQPPQANRGEGAMKVTATVTRGLTEMRFEGQPVAPEPAVIIKEIDTRVEQRRMLYAAQPNPPATVIGIWFDRRLPAREALPLVEALSAKYEVGVLAREQPPKQPSYPPHVAQRLEKIRATAEASQKFQMVEATTRAALGDCRAPVGVEGARESLVAALKSCGCAAGDLDLLEGVVAMGAGVGEPKVFLRRIKLRPRAKQVLVLGEQASVQELVDRLPVAGGEVAVRFGKSSK